MKIFSETLGELAPPMGAHVIITRAPELVYIKREAEGFRAYRQDAGCPAVPGELFDSFAVARDVTIAELRRQYGAA